MAASSSRTRSTGAALSSAFHRSISPSGRFYSATATATAASGSAFAFASSTASRFSASRSSSFFHQHRSASPTRVTLAGPTSPSPSVRFSIDNRPTSPRRGLSFSGDHAVVKKAVAGAPGGRRKTCMCSPTTHPGSFRCSLHKGFQGGRGQHHSISASSSRLNARRSAMTNSLVRIGTVEGEWVKRALAALIRPCAHQQRRRAAFQPRPSRLSVMSKAYDL